ncbi:MAG TPA: ParB/RepB/Spo0J family partition protein [Candidatus Paceibacterota bacterium]
MKFHKSKLVPGDDFVNLTSFDSKSIMSSFIDNSIFWVEVGRVKPNPFQPRREFDEARLQELADSIKMYGVLQPLVVTRKEVARDDGSFTSEYELISGERRLRASRLAGLQQVPVLIRGAEDTDREKLEMAIIENLQREDLNVVDRAKAFKRLVDEFGLKHTEIGLKMGRSREYVSNTLRILALSEEILNALVDGKITEGHTRPLLMLVDRPEEQKTLFLDIMNRKVTVREAELTSRRIAFERARKIDKNVDPEVSELEDKFKETLGTRVYIERHLKGGKLSIDFFTTEDLRAILNILEKGKEEVGATAGVVEVSDAAAVANKAEDVLQQVEDKAIETGALDDRLKEDIKKDEDTEIYSVKNFSV